MLTARIINSCVDFQKPLIQFGMKPFFSNSLKVVWVENTYDVIKSMYTNNKCAVKIENKHTHLFSQGHGVKQGHNLSSSLYNPYINELAKTREQLTRTIN